MIHSKGPRGRLILDANAPAAPAPAPGRLEIQPTDGLAPRELILPGTAPFARNTASRARDPGFWARAADFLGLRSLPPSVAAAGTAITFGFRDGAGPGAPMASEHVFSSQLMTRLLIADLGELRQGRFPRGLFGRHTPHELALLDAAISQGRGPEGARSLREAIHMILEGDERRAAIAALDDAAARVRRPAGLALHDLVRDPTGLEGPALDGRLPATIDKVLELRRLNRIEGPDLVNRHEVTGGNLAKVLPGGGFTFDAILKDVEKAEDSVHLAFFIVKEGRRCDQLCEALIAKARQGVKVRVLLDERGQMLGGELAFQRLIRRLEKGGVEVKVNWIVPGQGELEKLGGPDHRKEVVIDGRIAYTGGLNVGDDYLDVWHDVGVRVEGPAALQIQSEWMLTWLALGGEIDPGASDEVVRARYFPPPAAKGNARLKIAGTVPGESEEIRLATLKLIREARNTLDIENPYITNLEVQEALLAAAKRGVKVRLLVPAENNHAYCDLVARTHFPALLAAGAEIREIPGMAHGKVLLADGERGWIGTSNLDDLSLRKIHELDVLFDDRALAESVRAQIFERDAARARLLSVEDISTKQLALGRFWSLFRERI